MTTNVESTVVNPGYVAEQIIDLRMQAIELALQRAAGLEVTAGGVTLEKPFIEVAYGEGNLIRIPRDYRREGLFKTYEGTVEVILSDGSTLSTNTEIRREAEPGVSFEKKLVIPTTRVSLRGKTGYDDPLQHRIQQEGEYIIGGVIATLVNNGVDPRGDIRNYRGVLKTSAEYDGRVVHGDSLVGYIPFPNGAAVFLGKFIEKARASMNE